MTHVLTAFFSLVLVCVGVHAARLLRRFDRAALLGLLVLGVVTNPRPAHHRAAVANAMATQGVHGVMSSAPARAASAVRVTRQLEDRDLRLMSLSMRRGHVMSIGAFGRVFVLHKVHDVG